MAHDAFILVGEALLAGGVGHGRPQDPSAGASAGPAPYAPGTMVAGDDLGGIASDDYHPRAGSKGCAHADLLERVVAADQGKDRGVN
ncbi:MAG: hypothetical protein ACJ780_21770 [Solirubrobacteraceae bacterium]